jgi:hypothetical protein
MENAAVTAIIAPRRPPATEMLDFVDFYRPQMLRPRKNFEL